MQCVAFRLIKIFRILTVVHTFVRVTAYLANQTYEVISFPEILQTYVLLSYLVSILAQSANIEDVREFTTGAVYGIDNLMFGRYRLVFYKIPRYRYRHQFCFTNNAEKDNQLISESVKVATFLAQ